MSYIDYAWARAQRSGRWGDSPLDERLRMLTKGDPPFYGIIMLALMRADRANAVKLRVEWPAVCDECQARYDAPGAILASDPPTLHSEVLAS